MKKGIITGHDYVLVYHSKNVELFNKKEEKESIDFEYDNQTYRRDAHPVHKEFGNKRGTSEELYYDPKNAIKDGYVQLEDNENIFWKEVKGVKKFFIKAKTQNLDVFYRLIENKGLKKMYSIQNCETGLGITEVKNILMNEEVAKKFYPKPTKMIKMLLGSYQKKDALILDFFAGTGTTGHATMELNEEDGGTRNFILCTNNENNIGYNICYERLYRIINGKGTKKQKINWKFSNETPSFKNNSLQVFEIEHIDVNVAKSNEEVKKKIKTELSKFDSSFNKKTDLALLYDLSSLHPLSFYRKK